mgnify:CR=1 FL=1
MNRICTILAEEKEGWAFANINMRPFYSEGSKTLGYEIVEQLGWEAPDNIICPGGSGSLFTKVWKGISEFEKLGFIDYVKTKMHIAQAQGCSPIINAIDNNNNTPKGVFWNSKLSQDLRLNIILDKILQNSKSDKFSIADIGCGYGRLYEIIRERKLDGKVQYHGFDINQKIISFCKNNIDFENIKFSVSAFPLNETDYVVMSGTYNLTPTNNISLWEDYIIKNLTTNWKLVQKAMIFNFLIKEKRKIEKKLYYTELSWIKKICERNFCDPEVIKHNLLTVSYTHLTLPTKA